MCCLFGNNCNCNNCNRNIVTNRGPQGPAGPRGPIGPQGATGATGAQGPSGTNNIIYAGTNTTQTVATNTVIPISLITATAGTTMSVSSNAVNLPEAGTYLVAYFVNGSVTTGSLAVSLYLNGSQISGETITLDGSDGTTNAAGKTILITVTGAGTLTLVNTSADTATLNSATITVLKTA